MTTTTSYLKSFVSEEDYPKLLDVLYKIHNNTLKDTVSVVVLYGDGSNGKSILMEVMENLAPTSVRVPSPIYSHTAYELTNSSLIF